MTVHMGSVQLSADNVAGMDSGLPASLRLRPPRRDDEQPVLAGHRQMLAADGFTFALDYEPGMPWLDYLQLLADHSRGVRLPPGQVASTFLVAAAGGIVVGRSSIRHVLNESLVLQGGHIGYGVLPAHRRRGYATEILRQSLVIVRAIGADRVLVTCEDANIGSATVIEKCGGQLDSVIRVGTPARLIRRYWFD
jgi:predicted acetyltransferase